MIDQSPIKFGIQFGTKGVSGGLSDLQIIMAQEAREVLHEDVDHLYMIAADPYLIGKKLGRNNLFKRFYFPWLRETHAPQSGQEKRQVLPLATRSLFPFSNKFSGTNRSLTWWRLDASLERIAISSEVETATNSVKPLQRQ